MGYFKEEEWPYTITSVEESEVWADQSDLKKKVNAIIDSTKYNKKQLVLAWGYFGAGKTHKLHQLQKIIVKKNIGTCILGTLVDSPKNFGVLIKQLFFSLVWEQFQAKFVENFCDRTKSEDEIREKIKKVTKQDRDLTQAFLKLRNSLSTVGYEHSDITQIYQWMRGEPLNKFTREWFGRRLKEDRDFVNLAESMNRTLLLKGKDGTIKPVFWIVDDCQFLNSMPDKKLKMIQKGFKDIFDMAPNKFVLILSYAVGTSDEIQLLEDLRSRISSHLEVHPLTPQTALTYIKELNSHPKYAKNPNQTNKFYPLNEKSARTLVDLLDKAPGIRLLPRIVSLALDPIVQAAEEENLKTPIPSDYVSKKFKQIKVILTHDD